MKHQSYMQEHGTSYYLANLFFPRDLQQKVMTLYAFVRIPDDIVDAPTAVDEESAKELGQLESLFESYYTKEKEREEGHVFSDTAELFHDHEIDLAWSQAFFAAMRSDTMTKMYDSYEQLQHYMYGSAEVVGLMMCKLIGYDEAQESEVFRTGCLLGEAMQCTNFLRDIQEDYEHYGRIYVPTDRLQPYGLTHQDVIDMTTSKTIPDSWKQFMKDQIVAIRALYAEANTGIVHLHPKGRKAVYVASKMYEGILDQIESLDYNVFAGSARTTKWKKFKILCTSVIQYALTF